MNLENIIHIPMIECGAFYNKNMSSVEFMLFFSGFSFNNLYKNLEHS